MANYLYNGVELPALQDLPYKHAYINTSESFGYVLSAYSAPFVAVDDGLYILPVDSYPTYSYKRYYVKDGEWTLLYYGAAVENGGQGNGAISKLSSVIWANTDIVDESGEVVFTASDPIPVNPAPTLDPTALLMGWQVGNRIRGGA